LFECKASTSISPRVIETVVAASGFYIFPMQHKALFNQLRDRASALRAGSCDARAFAQSVGEASTLIASLPPAYARTMNDIVTRLESAAMFGGESCSFSHTDLYNALDMWLEKAREKLDTA
jgi:hypothetical protein